MPHLNLSGDGRSRLGRFTERRSAGAGFGIQRGLTSHKPTVFRANLLFRVLLASLVTGSGVFVTPLWRAVPELRLRHFSTTRTTPVQAARADCQATVSAWRRLSRDGYAGAGDAARGHQGRRVVAADFLQRSPPPGMTIMACPRDLRWCPRRAGSRPGKRAGRRGKGPAALSWEERQRKPAPRAATSVPTASQAMT
jgi:hypothetical protein